MEQKDADGVYVFQGRETNKTKFLVPNKPRNSYPRINNRVQ
jgi:hypothetical protein